MKKLLSLVLTIAIIICAVPFGAFAFTASAEISGTTGDCTWSLDGTVLTISGNGAMGDLHYTSSPPWGNNVTEVIIENGVTRIGVNAFYGCTGLTSISIPSSVTSLGKNALYWCKDIYITDLASWCSIDMYATSDAASWDGAYTEHNLYLNGELVEELVIPSNVTSIGNYAFYRCMSIKSVVIPKSIEQVGICAFWGSGLEKISVESQEPFKFGIFSFYFLENITDIFYKDYSSWQYFSSPGVFGEPSIHYNTCKYIEHIYSSNCDAKCNNCEWTREITGEHSYSSDCDAICDGCGSTRYTYAQHTYINVLDVSCEFCDAVRSVETWLIKTGRTGIYDISPNKVLSGFTKDSITIFDKDDNEVKYSDSKCGWPLVSGQEYKVVLNENFSYNNLYWNLVEKADTIFPDTSADGWYNDAVTYAVGAGLVTGYGGTDLFGTADNIQRQDFVVILARMAGVDLANYQSDRASFADVPSGAYYEKAILWAADCGITTGYNDGTNRFGVGDKITREQLVTFLYRYAKHQNGGISPEISNNAAEKAAAYPDFAGVTDYAEEAIIWALDKGVISGKGGTHIAPAGNALRCEIAQIMYNIFLNDIF